MEYREATLEKWDDLPEVSRAEIFKSHGVAESTTSGNHEKEN